MKMYQQSRPQGEELVLAHLGLVKRVALHLKARVPAYMELDELIQVGMMGLLEASRVFDPTKGVDFENFAHSRVRGAMLDEVRRLPQPCAWCHARRGASFVFFAPFCGGFQQRTQRKPARVVG